MTWCANCRQFLPRARFPRNILWRGGVGHYCRDCGLTVARLGLRQPAQERDYDRFKASLFSDTPTKRIPTRRTA